MAALYDFRCFECGERWEDFAPMGGPYVSYCPACTYPGHRAYSPPVVDCYSFGSNLHANRTPDHARKSYHEDDERRRYQAKRDLGITSKLVPKG